MKALSFPPANSPAFAQQFMLTGDDCTCHTQHGSCLCHSDALPEQEIPLPAHLSTKPPGRN